MKAYITVLSLSVVVTLAGACGGGESRPTPTTPAETTLWPMNSDSTIPFNDALVFIEFNSTDEDLGFHATDLRRPRLEGGRDLGP